MSEWTKERVELLAKFWREGMTTAEIGRRMGISKNAVIGKAHRTNLPGRPSPIKRSTSLTKKLLKTDQALALPKNCNRKSCCWPTGHPGDADFSFCESKALLGKPYCGEHYARAYVIKTPKQNDVQALAA